MELYSVGSPGTASRERSAKILGVLSGVVLAGYIWVLLFGFLLVFSFWCQGLFSGPMAFPEGFVFLLFGALLRSPPGVVFGLVEGSWLVLYGFMMFYVFFFFFWFCL